MCLGVPASIATDAEVDPADTPDDTEGLVPEVVAFTPAPVLVAGDETVVPADVDVPTAVPAADPLVDVEARTVVPPTVADVRPPPDTCLDVPLVDAPPVMLVLPALVEVFAVVEVPEVLTLAEDPDAPAFTLVLAPAEVPDVLTLLDVPTVTVVPLLPVLVDVPTVVEVPEPLVLVDAPTLTEVLPVPVFVEVPAVTEVPAVPDTGLLVEVPAVTEVPEVPLVPEVPTLTDVPLFVDVPALTDVPLFVDVPTLIDAALVVVVPATDVPALVVVPTLADAPTLVDPPTATEALAPVGAPLEGADVAAPETDVVIEVVPAAITNDGVMVLPRIKSMPAPQSSLPRFIQGLGS